MLTGPILGNLTSGAGDSPSYYPPVPSVIDLSHNQLTSLPSVWLVKVSVQYLDLSHNHISGVNTPFWPWFYQTAYSGDGLQFMTFYAIRLDNNRIEGPLTTLPPAGHIYLFNNSLEGRWGAFSTGRHGPPANTPHCLREEPVLTY